MKSEAPSLLPAEAQAQVCLLSMLCLSCRAPLESSPLELRAMIVDNLHGNDKVRAMHVPTTVKWELPPLGVSAAGLLVRAGQSGTVLQGYAAYVVQGHCKRAA